MNILKKVIAALVILAAAAGIGFAQVTVGGTVEARFALYNAELGDHSPADDPKPTANGTFGAAYVQLSGKSQDGSLSGLFRFRNDDVMRADPWFHRVFINWRPIRELNIFLGIDQDGKFGTDALEDWSFHQGACDYTSLQWWDFWRAVFPGNWDGFGVAFSIYPVQGVDINIIVPFGSNKWPQATKAGVEKKHNAEDLYTSGYRVQANFAVPDIGKVMFSYKGPYNNNHFGGGKGGASDDKYSRSFLDDDPAYGSFGASFLMDRLVSGLQVHAGLSTDNIKPDLPDNEALPLYFGGGVHFQTGNFGVKFRLGAAVNQYFTKEHLFITTNVMPWYSFGNVSVYLDIGMSLDKANADADMENGFWVNPYMKVQLSGGYLHTGLVIRRNINGQGNVSVDMTDDYVRVAFPLIVGYSF
jgi:hypothetical protein